VGETDPFLNHHLQFIYLIISQDYSFIIRYTLQPKYCLKKNANLFVILRNSRDMWKSGKENIEESRGERTNLKHRIILYQTFIFTNIRPSVNDIKRTPKPAASNAS
jgi:hypothetical protein